MLLQTLYIYTNILSENLLHFYMKNFNKLMNHVDDSG